MNDDEVIRQRISGRSARAIAKAQATTVAEVNKALDRFTETTIDDKVRKHTLALELARLDEMQEVFYARALEGDVQCGALITKIIERRCTMLGLYTPQTATLQVIEARRRGKRQPTKSVPSSSASGVRPGTIQTTRHPPIRYVAGPHQLAYGALASCR
jgi:hypothetical protein